MITGTYSNIGGELHLPSGTAVYGCQILDYPEMASGERNVTNHAGLSGGIYHAEKLSNNLMTYGDFVVMVYLTPGMLSTLNTALKNKTLYQPVYLTDPAGGYLFSGWITKVKEQNADAQTPDSAKASVTIAVTGPLTIV